MPKRLSWTLIALALLVVTLDAQTPVVMVGDTLTRRISTGVTQDKFQVSASGGTLLYISGRNAHATQEAYVKCTQQLAANTTPGTTAIWIDMVIPFGGLPVAIPVYAKFTPALTCYLVTGKADTSTIAVGADDVSVNIVWSTRQ